MLPALSSLPVFSLEVFLFLISVNVVITFLKMHKIKLLMTFVSVTCATVLRHYPEQYDDAVKRDQTNITMGEAGDR